MLERTISARYVPNAVSNGQALEPYSISYDIPARITSKKITPRLMLSMGRRPEGNTYAKEDARFRTVGIFFVRLIRNWMVIN